MPRTESQAQNWISNLLDIQSSHGDVERAKANERRRGDWRKNKEVKGSSTAVAEEQNNKKTSKKMVL